MSEFQLTDEQGEIVDACRAGKNVVIEAGAGTGKTATLKVASQQMAGAGLYLAYNKAIQLEADASFPQHVRCKTAHSMAFQEVGKHYRGRLDAPRVPAREAARILRVNEPIWLSDVDRVQPTQVARIAVATVDKFCYSADRELNVQHVPHQNGIEHDAHDYLAAEVLPLAKTVWEDLRSPDGQLKFQHDHYLKLWALSDPQLPSDFVLFDEAQDANPVIEAVVKAQRSAQLIAVGDANQQLYAWRGAQDALARWDADTRLYLSQSWRFGQGVADEANKWLSLLRAKLRLIGAPNQISTVAPIVGWPDAVLCRTNAEAVQQCINGLADRKHVALVGGSRQVVSLAEACLDLQAGRGTSHPELFAFNTWGEVQTYANEDEGADLKPWVRLIDNHGADVIIAAMRRVVDDKPGRGRRPDLIVSTGHKAKGREWPKVRIAPDFKAPGLDPETGDDKPVPKADAMLAYVAVTRARVQLDPGGLSWIDDPEITKRCV